MKSAKEQVKIERPQKEKVAGEQALKLVKALSKRKKKKLIATLRFDSH